MASLYVGDYSLRQKLVKLNPTPGYCIFIDVVNSVALKDQGIVPWCDRMNNLIHHARSWLADTTADTEEADTNTIKPWGLPALKIVGDCIMFYIPKKAMSEGTTALTIFSGVLNTVRTPTQFAPQTRAAITRCDNVLEITFVEETKDFHGKEIDLAARLLKEAEPRELLMNEKFYWEARALFEGWRYAGSKGSVDDACEQFGMSVQGPWTKTFKGFQKPTSIYKWCASKDRKQTRQKM